MTDEKTSIPLQPSARRSPKGPLRKIDAFLTTWLPTLWPGLKLTVVKVLWPGFKMTVIIAVGLSILLVAAVHVNNHIGARKLSAAQKLARDRGLALSMNEYFARLPDIPDSENAAFLYLAAFDRLWEIGIAPESPYVPCVSRQLSKTLTDDQKLKDAIAAARATERNASLPALDYMLADARTYVTKRRTVIDLIHDARRLTQCRYPIDWQGTMTLQPYLTEIRASARLLTVAAWIDAEDGRPSDAAARIRDSLALARSLQGEPVLISNLVEMASISITALNLQRVVSRTDLSDDDLRSLQEDFQRTLDSFSMRPALEGELAAVSDMIADFRAGLPPPSPDGESADPDLTASRLSIFISGRRFSTDQAIATRGLLIILDNVDSPSPEFLTDPDPIDSMLDEAANGHCVFAAMLLPSWSRSVGQAESTRAKLRATVAGLAALRYYNDHDSWPATLETLVPDYVEAVPIDPFTGKPLIYVLKDDGIIIYSVGRNAVDDGEGYYASPPEGVKRTGDDVGFRIWK